MMPTYPWRFQADLKADEPNPDVTVFLGDTILNEATGERTVHQSTADPVIVKLSELTEYVAAGLANGVTRAAKPPTP
jgi:hypothetical protein